MISVRALPASSKTRNKPHHFRRSDRAFTLIELLVVIVIMVVLISILLPILKSMRQSAVAAKMAGDRRSYAAMTAQQSAAAEAQDARSRGGPAIPPRRPAQVRSLEAKVDLTPRLSVGTAEPESIYEARFSGKLLATAPDSSPGPTEVDLSMPLPPQVISLADLSITVDGEPIDNVTIGEGELLWHGKLPVDHAAVVELTYSAVGKGVYTLQTPAGRILDRFTIALTANGSDVRMLELSMQPTGLVHEAGRTIYTWDYKRLMFGRPISLDVLGIAPIDRLGELSWLGPLSVILFGVLIGLVGRAHPVQRFDRWALLLLIGTFTGTYPLMYFAQQFVPIRWAILVPAAVTLQIIGWRAVTLLGPRLAALGVVLPAAITLALALCAAVQPVLQGMLLTVGGIGFFITAMVLLPKAHIGKPARSEPGCPQPGIVPA
jgi:prepilin-type N-terminal cleavage/methylation domain-containing protein